MTSDGSCAPPTPPHTPRPDDTPRRLYAYVGSRTTRERNARGDGITVYRVDPAGGRLTLVSTVSGLVNPSFLVVGPQGDRLYTVHGDGNEVSVLAIDPDDGALRLLQRRHCGGRNPVHLALDPTGRFLVVSDHHGDGAGGSLVVLPVTADGTLEAVSQRLALPGEPGPHRIEQPYSKPHANSFSPDGRWVAVPDKGLDRIFVFRFAEGRLGPAATPWTDAREGAGPRHIAFHPTAPYAYVVNELDSTVTSCWFDTRTGHLQPFQILSTLPDSFTGTSRAAEIEIAANGRTLYASNRGFDSIAVFLIDQGTGRLTYIEATPSGGHQPRFFTLAPDERHLYALNESSHDIVTFSVDPESGRLGPGQAPIACGSPVCMVFAAIVPLQAKEAGAVTRGAHTPP